MPKTNDGYDGAGGDTPGFTTMADSWGNTIDVAKASYDACYWYGKSMVGMPMSVLKRGFMPGADGGTD